MNNLEDIEILQAELHKRDEEIKELKNRLKNSITPKFKIGQKVWYVDKYAGWRSDIGMYTIRESGSAEIVWCKVFGKHNYIAYNCKDSLGKHQLHYENKLFNTREEAENQLKKIEDK